MPKAADVVEIFNGLFVGTFNTELIGGGDEPLYLPAETIGERHRMVFSFDYFSSALHEISHWCIAGSQRREKIDFGYWYEPDGRSVSQQQVFEHAEVKPQALEWIFSMAAGITFRVSVDNLHAVEYDSSGFSKRVRQQVSHYLIGGLPARAQQFAEKLLAFYQPHITYTGFCVAMSSVISVGVGQRLPAASGQNTNC